MDVFKFEGIHEVCGADNAAVGGDLGGFVLTFAEEGRGGFLAVAVFPARKFHEIEWQLSEAPFIAPDLDHVTLVRGIFLVAAYV